MPIREDACGAQDFHHVLLGEVGSDFLVGADDDVVLGRVPVVAQGLRGLWIDECRNHTALLSGVQETEGWAFRDGRNNGEDGLTHGSGLLAAWPYKNPVDDGPAE